MAWLEMTRDPKDRPRGWGVGECLWSPRRNEIGRPWAFWETMQQVQPGDVVFHLCGRWPETVFTGFSTAAGPCVWLENGPNGPGGLYRVDLADYAPLETPLKLRNVFEVRDTELRAYFMANAKKGRNKERLFYVPQAGRLQCLNGAYLSYLSPELLKLVFAIELISSANKAKAAASSAETGTAMIEAARRIGQHEFSQNVKRNFGHRCCFPVCAVDDVRFLIGAHIARWADHPELRGLTSNGLSLCLYHDKAFEIGAFTIDHMHRIALGPKAASATWLQTILAEGSGKVFAPCQIPPSIESLAIHWSLHGFEQCLEAATAPPILLAS
jgi:putative restriction endonuclease